VLKVTVVGDYDPTNQTHCATDEGLAHAATALGLPAITAWVPTIELAKSTGALAGAGCLLVSPGSPYRSMEGALNAIRYARTSNTPLLGTCGGFQHVVLEVARDVLGYEDAEHAETSPTAPRLFITPLSCSLKGKTMVVQLKAGSVVASTYGRLNATERYYCNFGLNQAYVGELEAAGLRVTGTDRDGEARIVELTGHPFFLGTLFVPQASSTTASPHPLLTALLKAAATPTR
jgi:CTP synthase (UTP-ammonia lyase)